MITRNFNLYLNAGHSVPLVINVNQYDSGEQWVFTLYNSDGTQYTPSTGAIVGIKSDGLGIINSGSVVDGKVVINETQQMTAAVGKAVFELLIDSQTHGTANFVVLVEEKPGNNADLSESDLSLLQEAIDATSPLPTGGTVGQVLTKTANGSTWSNAGTPTQEQVADAVSDWADEHITVSTGVVIDTSLAVAGAAADSKKVGDEITDLKSAITNINNEILHVNRFNKDTVIANHYISAQTGEVLPVNGYDASDWIDISNLTTLRITYCFIVGFYNESKVFISSQVLSPIETLHTLTIPEGAYYFRISAQHAHVSKVQVGGADISFYKYVPYSTVVIPNAEIKESQISKADIIVNKTGVIGNTANVYTSLTQALYDHVDDEAVIRVMPGTYNLHTEYIEKWGASAVDDMKDADESIFNGFQFGAIIRNKKIIFEAGSRVVCDYTYKSDGTTPQTVNGTHRICAFRVDYNVEIIGLDLTVAHVFYAIHDDYGLTDTPYTNKYENCRIIGSDITNANCIGGGCKKYSRHILNNCYFDNGSTWMYSARYHNTNQANAVPEVYVSNCYFNTFFAVQWYGTQTTKMKAYVNNCKAMQIVARAETADSTVENVELHKWCNEETGY